MENNRLENKIKQAILEQTPYIKSSNKLVGAPSGRERLATNLTAEIMRIIEEDAKTLNSLSATTNEQMVEEIAKYLAESEGVEYSCLPASHKLSYQDEAREIHSKISSVYEARLKQQEAETCKKLGEWLREHEHKKFVLENYEYDYVGIKKENVDSLLSGRPPWNE